MFQALGTPAGGSCRPHLLDQVRRQLEQSLSLTPGTSKIILVTGPRDSGTLPLCYHITGLLTPSTLVWVPAIFMHTCRHCSGAACHLCSAYGSPQWPAFALHRVNYTSCSFNYCTHDTLMNAASRGTYVSMLIAAGKSHTVTAAVEASEGPIQTAFVVCNARTSVSSWPGCILTALGYMRGQMYLNT